MPEAAKIVVIRFSAMGDVAMTAPVLMEFAAQYPGVRLVMVSRVLYAPFFRDVPNLHFHPFDPKLKHKGFFGLFRLFRELKAQRVTAVADLHNNLRSSILRILFFLFGIKTRSVDKGRLQKKRLTRQVSKLLMPLKQTTERYADVFRALGFSLELAHRLKKKPKITTVNFALQSFTGAVKTNKWIGVSPFAQHLQKVYPLFKMENVVSALAAQGHQLFIFGGTAAEENIAEDWASKHPGVISMVNKVSLETELHLISALDVMISMDSSGMHLASLTGTPVISIWGATHPYAGFMGYGQSMSDAVQIELECRPCSIYGNKPCFRGDFACMNNLPELAVITKVNQRLNE